MMYPHSTLDETRVASLADRLGLTLVRDDAPATSPDRYQLIAAQTHSPVYPGGPAAGAPLADIEDWLSQPWE